MPSSTFQVVDEWANYVATKKIDSTTTTGDAFKLVLTNSAVTKAGTQVLADITPCTNGGGAASLTHTFAESGAGTGIWQFKLGANTVVFTATGAGFTFRYAVLYDDTPAATPTDPIIGFWDYGSSQAVSVGETVTVDVTAASQVAYSLTVS